MSHTLRSEGFDASEDGTGRGTPLVAAPLTKGSATGDGVNAPGRRQEDDVNIVAYALNAKHGNRDDGESETFIPATTGVRRLTPRECERLQGLPDDWTLLDPKTPDSRRYSGLGDAVTASVAEWIGRRFVT